jgi:CRP/FNR family cyclic AMP-dependent transcriptional regulator
MPNKLIQELREIPLFAELGRDDMRALTKLVEREELLGGSVICRQGEVGQTAYIVESGELCILHVDSQGVEREVNRLGPGDHFGETSLLLGEPRDATIQVLKDATVLYINKSDFDELLEQRPEMVKALQMRPHVALKYHARFSHFKWLEPDEVVVVSQHRHNVLLLNSLIVPSFALLVVFVGCMLWFRHTGAFLALVTGAGLSGVILVFVIYLVADHWDDIYIVTNKRVVRRTRTPLGREERTDAPLRTIQDIQETQVGLLAQLYDFGDLIIETAGERGHVAFREIPDPEGVREIIFEQIRRRQAGAKVAERAAIRADMQQYFDVQGGERKPPEPPPPPPEEKRRKPPLPDWFFVPIRVIRYFLPPLRYEYEDTVTWRKHWIALIKPVTVPTVLLVVFTLGIIYVLVLAPPDLRPTDWTLPLIGYCVALVVLVPWWLWRFDDWQNDIYQVTSTRIIDVERLPFYLREDRREASLGVIQNVQFEIPSTLAKLLNYGSVTIETAGAGPFTFDLVKDPSGVQTEIFRRMEAFRKRQDQATAERHRNELLDWFAVYDQMRRSKTSTSQLTSSNPQEA